MNTQLTNQIYSQRTIQLYISNYFYSNDYDCTAEEATILLSLSTCKDDQFACNDGLCIDIEQRCDSTPDCYDKSDEFGCRKIRIDQSYQSFIAPPARDNTDTAGMTAMTANDIDISVDIQDILEINEISSLFQVQFYLRLTWFDSRLTYYDLRNDTGLNTLSPVEKLAIWVPVLVFDNTDNKIRTTIDGNTNIFVEKQGSFSLSGAFDPTSRQMYKGSENPITLSQFYNIR